MKDLVIIGTGGFAREVLQIAYSMNAAREHWRIVGFLDDRSERHGQLVHGYPIMGGVDMLDSLPDVEVAIGVGGTATRRRIVQRCLQMNHLAFATLIHPLAWIGDNVDIGHGTVICAGTMITTDISIGAHVILNLGCTVGHDSAIEDAVTVAPGARISGTVRVGEGCDLGTNSAVIQGVTIGAWSIIGAGAVVTKDIPANATAVGVPAKVIKERPEGWHLTA